MQFRYKTWAGDTKWIIKRKFLTRREAQEWEQRFHQQTSGDMDIGRVIRAFIAQRDFIRVITEMGYEFKKLYQ